MIKCWSDLVQVPAQSKKTLSAVKKIVPVFKHGTKKTPQRVLVSLQFLRK
jgi:hypothetical protein